MQMQPASLVVFAVVAAMAAALSPSSSLAGQVRSNAAFQSNATFQSVPADSAPQFQSAAVTDFSVAAPPTSIVGANYRIGRDDTLVVDVFEVPDLSRTVEVDSNGQILLPLIGQVPASGRTAEQLSQQIATALGVKYVRDPQVTVTVKNSESQRVTVDGAVVQPGTYPIETNTTLLKAIAMAKGPDMKLANVNKVAIFRTDGQRRTEAVFDLEEIRDGKAADPQVVAGDIIVVDTSGMRRFLQDVGGLAPWAGAAALF